MELHNEIVRRLNRGGWRLVRAGKHETWEHPGSKERISVAGTIRDTGRKKANYMRAIERVEEEWRAKQDGAAAAAPPKPVAAPPAPAPAALPEPPAPPAPPRPVPGRFCEWLAVTRDARGLSRKDLAELMKDHGWNYRTVSNVENGLRRLNPCEWASWLDIFDQPELPAAITPDLSRPQPDCSHPPTLETHPIPTPEPEPTMDAKTLTAAAAATAATKELLHMNPKATALPPMRVDVESAFRAQKIERAVRLLANVHLADGEVEMLVDELRARIVQILLPEE